MGNRAVITDPEKRMGVYLHWNGGRDSVNAFLVYMRMRNIRPFDEDNYGWARLCQVVGNFFGGDLSIGIDQYENLDTDNYDNGVYIVRNWQIIGREYNCGEEQCFHDLHDMILEIDSKQPEDDRLGKEKIEAWLKENEGTYENPVHVDI